MRISHDRSANRRYFNEPTERFGDYQKVISPRILRIVRKISFARGSERGYESRVLQDSRASSANGRNFPCDARLIAQAYSRRSYPIRLQSSARPLHSLE